MNEESITEVGASEEFKRTNNSTLFNFTPVHEQPQTNHFLFGIEFCGESKVDPVWQVAILRLQPIGELLKGCTTTGWTFASRQALFFLFEIKAGERRDGRFFNSVIRKN